MLNFEEFARRQSPYLLRRALALADGDWYAAEDLVQVTLFRVSCHWGDVAQPESYAQRVLTNLSRDRFRTNRREPQILSFGSPAEIDTAHGRSYVTLTGKALDDNAELEQAVCQLSSRQKQVLLLRYWYGMPVAEVAKTLGIAEGTVKGLNTRALRVLRHSMTSRSDVAA